MAREVSAEECLRVSGDPAEFMRMTGVNADGEPSKDGPVRGTAQTPYSTSGGKR
jgi:hypothetical protein